VRALKQKRAGARRKPRAPRANGHLLAGFLACGQCGGGFTEAHHKGVLGRSWPRNQGNRVCECTLRLRTEEVEARVLRAIRQQVLTPENGAYAVDRTLAELAKAPQGTAIAVFLADASRLRTQPEVLFIAREAGEVPAEEDVPRVHAHHQLEELGALVTARARDALVLDHVDHGPAALGREARHLAIWSAGESADCRSVLMRA